MGRERGAVLAVAGCMVLFGCMTSTGDEARDGGAVAVTVGPPSEPWVLDSIPAAAAVLRVAAGPSEESSVDPLSGGATLYGNADAADPLDRELLLVGSSSGSAEIGGVNPSAPGAHPVDLDLGFGGATFVAAGVRSWVIMPAAMQDGVAYVIGQGISEADLIGAALGMDHLAAPLTIRSDALPEGMVPLVAGAYGDGPGSSRGERFAMQLDGVRLEVFAVRADPRLAILWGFWIVGDGTALTDALLPTQSGTTGFRAGPMPDTIFAEEAYGVVWASDGAVVSVVGAAQQSEEATVGEVGIVVEAIAAQLRVGDSAELIALGRKVCDTRRYSPNCRDWTAAG